MSTDTIVRNHVIWACAAGAVPVPFVDFVAVTAIQLDMLKQLAAHYAIPYSEEQGKSWLTALSSSVVARLGGNLIKGIPVVGSIIGGVSMSIMSGASTYAMGQVAILHFNNRGSFEDLDIKQAKEDFDKAYEEGKEFVKKTQAETADDHEHTEKKKALELLEHLSSLHKNGILTDEEFSAKKSDILKRL